jgi:hypothetical protein
LLFVRVVSLGGPHTWDFVPGSDARGEIPSTATRRVDEAPRLSRGTTVRIECASPDEKNSKRTKARRHQTIPWLRIAYEHCAAVQQAAFTAPRQERTRRLPMHVGEPGGAEHRARIEVGVAGVPEPVIEIAARSSRGVGVTDDPYVAIHASGWRGAATSRHASGGRWWKLCWGWPASTGCAMPLGPRRS